MMLNPPKLSRDPRVTRRSLIDSLGQPGNEAAWIRFYDTYGNMIWGLATTGGLSRTEAEEVVQETVISVYKKMPEFTYNPAKGSFKIWLFNLINWRIKDQFRKRRPDSLQRADNLGSSPNIGNGVFENIPAPQEALDEVWENQWRTSALEKAMEALKGQVKAKQYQIFDLLIMQKCTVSKVAESLGVTAAQVYLVKHRLGILLKKEMKRLEQAGLT
jgi:RNA polymerase sigma factor (sigma-70 family)